MNLLALEATLGLDITGFDTNVDAAKISMENLSTDISSKTTSIDDEIDALDKELDDLEAEIKDLELDLDIDDLETEIDTLTKDIKSQDFKSAFMEGFYDGLTDATGEILQKVIEAGFEFIGDSVETAANSGTAAADAYNDAFARLSIGTENLKNALGNKLLPLLTVTYNSLASILGVSDYDIQLSMLEQLESYKFDNLQQAEESLRNIFAFGETYDATTPELSFDSILASYESQEKYWEDFSAALVDLQERDVSDKLISQLLTGTQEDYSRISWLASLTDKQLSSIVAASEAVDAARASTAALLTDAQLKNDPTYQSYVEDYDDFMKTVDRGGGRRFEDVPDLGGGRRWEEALDDTIRNLDKTISDTTGSNKPSDDVGAQLAALSSAIGSLNTAISTIGQGDTIVNVSIDGNEVAAVVTSKVERNMARAIANRTKG